MKKVLFLALLGTVGLWVSTQAFAGHSSRGCFRCHLPHHAGDPNTPADYGVPLWSTMYNSDGIPTFDKYTSKTFDKLGTDLGQPDGAARMCLGCHDGSYSKIGSTSTRLFKAGDLARSHPVSFTYDSALAAKVPGGTLRDPSSNSGFGGTITQDLLDSKNKVQCISCHDVHATGVGEYMLRWDNEIATETTKMCRVCHNK